MCNHAWRLRLEYLRRPTAGNYAAYCYHLQTCEACRAHLAAEAKRAEAAVMPEMSE